MNNFQWIEAQSVDEALAGHVKGAAFKAGGIDLVDLMKDHLAAPPRLVNIRNIKALKFVYSDGEGLKLGPLTTLAELAEHPVVKLQWRALSLAAGHAATPQVRNMATVGGNLLQRPRCWYFRNENYHCRKKGGEICYAQSGENQYHAIFHNALCAIVHPSATACALVAHHAKLELTSSKGKREVLLEEFLTLPSVELHRENSIGEDEIITQIRVPATPPGSSSAYIKQGQKESFDWPLAEVAVVLAKDTSGKCKEASIVLGAAAPVPYRVPAAEEKLKGAVIDEDIAHQAAEVAMKGATPLSHNAYKVPIFKTIIARTILMANQGGAA
ncbi:MAG TPA: xanthine dehydrogenase family protein subunit M [Tepidisphaeraceae bacterium]|nr:xanthine dehydrogenase family protein subunit M [Tepidisphaeraceae bacterium]